MFSYLGGIHVPHVHLDSLHMFKHPMSHMVPYAFVCSGGYLPMWIYHDQCEQLLTCYEFDSVPLT